MAIDQHMLEARWQALRPGVGSGGGGFLAMPWELGLPSLVLGLGGVLPGVPLLPTNLGPAPPMPMPGLPVALCAVAAVALPAPPLGRRRVGPLPSQQDDAKRRLALHKFARLLAAAAAPAGGSLPDEGSLADILAGKATGTLHRRADSLLAYVRWAKRAGVPCFPLGEQAAYDYLQFLKVNAAAPTRASSFRQAVAFGGGVLDLAGAQDVLCSKRVAGAAITAYKGKRITKKAQPFSARLVCAMEEALADAAGPLDLSDEELVFIGFVLFLIHARARFADAARVSCEPRMDLDSDGEGFIEVGATELKTGRGWARLRRALPLVGHARGCSDQPWAEGWLAARGRAGLDAGKDDTLMPVPLLGGGFGNSRLDSAEGVHWLRNCLPKFGVDNGALADFGTHSGKATLLSWMAKAGEAPDDRRLLGAHATPGDTSLLEYSRDALAGPLLRLHRVLRLVRRGDFDPDVTRSGRWRKGVVIEEPPGPVARRARSGQREPQPGDAAKDTSSPSGGRASPSSPTKEEEPTSPVPSSTSSESGSSVSTSSEFGSSDDDSVDVPCRGAPGGEVWRSRRTGAAHAPAADGSATTACGLLASALDIVVLDGWPRDTSRHCRHRGCARRAAEG
jgi:hypothetical protein